MLSYIIPLLIISSALYDGCAAKKNWECEPQSVSAYSTNEGLLNIQLKTERVGRTGFFFSGTFFWNLDIDDSVLVEVELYRSTTGAESDYKLTPMSIPRQTFIEYLNTYYKDMVIKNLGDCSDLPQYEDERMTQLPKKTTPDALHRQRREDARSPCRRILQDSDHDQPPDSNPKCASHY
ncbi:GL17763 [Drosophila persimilis]|uniref:GL17763 n=1 Tax=Drosophila persimilis TaxID=7234 RepID=B4GIW2_DROPE|nr:GL17763 [Drosophila persimilis]